MGVRKGQTFVWILILVLARINFSVIGAVTFDPCCPSEYFYNNGTCSPILENLKYETDTYLATPSMNVSGPPFLCKDGSIPLLVLDVKNTTGISASGEGCIQRRKTGGLEVYKCQKKKCIESKDKSLCLPKCCEMNKAFSVTMESVACLETNLKWSPIIYKNVRSISDKSLEVQWIRTPPRTLCVTGVFYFQTPYLRFPKTLFRVLEDGRVIHKERSHWLEIPSGSFCLEGILPQNGSKVEDLVYRCLETTTDETVYEGFSMLIEYRIGIIIGCYVSAIFVFLTILVYILLWEIQNIHGWTLLCSFVSLFSLYMHVGFMQGYHMMWGTDANNRNLLCWLIGVGLHFSYLSFFTWASVVNFDLWYTFRNLRTVAQRKRRCGRFLKYTLAGVGIPLFITGLSVTFDFLYRNDELAEYFFPDPDYGSDKCFLARNESPVAYWLAPIGSLLTVNIIFIVVTISSVYRAQRTASIAVNSTSCRHKQSLKLFGKLLVVMGVFWIFDIISFVFHRDFVPWYFAIFDVFNACHGIFIFIIFVCKKSTLRSLETKYTWISSLSEAMSRCWKSSRGCCFYVPNQLHKMFTQTSRRVSAASRRSTQSDHPTEMSIVAPSSTV